MCVCVGLMMIYLSAAQGLLWRGGTRTKGRPKILRPRKVEKSGAMIAVPCLLLARVAFWCRGQCVMVAAPFLRAEWVSTLVVCGGLPCLFIATFALVVRDRERSLRTRAERGQNLDFLFLQLQEMSLRPLNIGGKKVTRGGPFSKQPRQCWRGGGNVGKTIYSRQED